MISQVRCMTARWKLWLKIQVEAISCRLRSWAPHPLTKQLIWVHVLLVPAVHVSCVLTWLLALPRQHTMHLHNPCRYHPLKFAMTPDARESVSPQDGVTVKVSMRILYIAPYLSVILSARQHNQSTYICMYKSVGWGCRFHLSATLPVLGGRPCTPEPFSTETIEHHNLKLWWSPSADMSHLVMYFITAVT